MVDILDLHGWKALGTRLDGDEYEIEAEYTVLPDVCLKCGVVGNLYRHGPKLVTIRDSPIRGKHVRILARAQRYKCRDCASTFIQPLGGLHGAMRMTERCAEYIQSQCLRDTFVRVAEHVGCDDKTVRTIAGDYIKQLNAEYKPLLPEWVGMDETQIDGKLRCIITDVVNRVPVDMLPDRDKPLVTSWLYQFKDRTHVKGLAIDMWKPFKDAARAVFPDLPVVVDKFHLVRMANRAMDDIRTELAKGEEKAVGRDWMRRKSLLRMRYKHLDEKGRFNLQMWLDNEPHVATAYRLKEAFYDIYDASNRAEAERLLDAWRKSVPADMKRGKKSFMPLLTSTRNWRDEMLTYFDHRISNGYTEALNGVVKVINRSGRGYSFEVLRARLLFKNRDHGQPRAELGELMSRSTPRHEMLLEMLGNRCQSCQGVFEGWMLFAHDVPTVVPSEKPRRMYLCPNCHRRFHMESARGHHSGSTQ
ncbi:ISL3 family transposase [Massilia sp. TN1-12]|uniref:ISL3 family transposase n=1 Tax=Massilia paldalensis TaxID=3377675 RepID=UPI00384EC017